MVILVPWKPVALVLGLLSASILSAISDQRLCATEKISTGHLAARSRGSCQTTFHKPNPNRASQRIGSPIDRRDCLNEHNRLMASECVGQE